MTNEERQQAIEWLKRRPVMMAGAKRMYDLAVEALEAYVPGTNVGDMISQQAAIEAILHRTNFKTVRELFEYNTAHNLIGIWSGGINDAIDAVIAVPPAEPEQRWTPISERLPKEKINPNTSDFEEVLCSTTFGDVRAYKFGTPLGWKEPHFWNGPGGMMDEYVLAWMPLPAPWENKEEKNETDQC